MELILSEELVVMVVEVEVVEVCRQMAYVPVQPYPVCKTIIVEAMEGQEVQD